MRADLPLVVALLATFAADAARAQTGPVIVVPGKQGVATTVDGIVIDGAVVWGDWGLARPGHGRVIVEGPIGFYESFDSRGYYPATGRRPRTGRVEVEPPPRPRPSTNFYRDWSSQSDMSRPVTEYPPFDPPPVILAPRRGPW